MRPLPFSLSLVSALAFGVSAALAQQAGQAPGQAGQLPGPGAQQVDPTPQELLRQYDTDSSMSLSREEFARLYEDRVEIMGQNDEPTPQAGDDEQVPGNLFTVLDLDEDMQLSEGELGQSIALIASTRRANQSAQAGGAAGAAPGQAGESTDLGALEENEHADVAAEEPGSRESGPAAGAPDENSDVVAADEVEVSNSEVASEFEGGGALDAAEESSRGAEELAQVDDAEQDLGVTPAGEPDDPALTPADEDEIGTPGVNETQLGAAQSSENETQSGENELERLAQNSPGEVEGRTLMSQDGEEIGEIDELVRDRESGELHAVVKSGGFLGIGENESVIPLSELRLEQDSIVWSSADAAAQLEQMSYEESQYESLDQEVAAGEDEEQQDVAGANP